MLDNLTSLGVLESDRQKQEVPSTSRLKSGAPQHPSGPHPPPNAKHSFVTTALDVLELHTDDPRESIQRSAKTYYRLTPTYFAWLYRKMSVAHASFEAGKLDPQIYRATADRFNAVREMAIHLFSETTLKDAVHTFDPESFKLPVVQSNWLYPKDGSWPFTQAIPPDAIRQVKAIEAQALAARWSEVRLYQNRGRYRFPCGEDYGLVCFVGAGVQIGEVSTQSIELIRPGPRRTITRFYNPDVEQPWLKRTEMQPVPEAA